MIRRIGKIQVLGWLLAALVLVLAACAQPGGATATLSVEVVGNGTVVSDPAGIDITSPGTTNADFATGTEVTLTATAAAGSTFDAWGGACDGATGNTCTLTVDEALSVTATFTTTPVGPFTLDVITDGSGTGTVTSSPAGIDCGADCTEDFADGTTVTLTATADAGATFASWTGCDSSTTNECTVVMDSAQTVTATFALEGDTTPATFTILQETDDAEEYLDNHATNPDFPTGSVQTASSDLDLNYAVSENVGTVVGLRFANATIPQGATIVSASLTFTADAPGQGTVTYTIAGQDADDAATFEYGGTTSPATFGITSRTKTTANAQWTSDTTWTADVTTSDISNVLQEIVDRTGWASGNALALIITADVMNADNYRVAQSFSGGTPPVLNVSYIAP